MEFSIHLDQIPTSDRHTGKARPIDSRPLTEIQVEDETPKAVADFCYMYLGDTLSARGVCVRLNTLQLSLEEVQRIPPHSRQQASTLPLPGVKCTLPV